MKRVLIALGVALLMVLTATSVFAATVGQPLDNPESGWTRYETSHGTTQQSDSLDSNFTWSGNWLAGYFSDASRWTTNTTALGLANYSSSVSFNFTGTRLRIIGCIHFQNSNSISITIDGTTKTFSQYTAGTSIWRALNYDSYPDFNLSSGQHQVTITNNSSPQWVFDAIDVLNPTPSSELCSDYSIVGKLGSFNPGTISSNSQVTQTFTTTGAQLGDIVEVSFDQDLQGVTLYGYVSATNQITVVFQNSTGNSKTLAAGNVRIRLSRHTRL